MKTEYTRSLLQDQIGEIKEELITIKMLSANPSPAVQETIRKKENEIVEIANVISALEKLEDNN